MGIEPTSSAWKAEVIAIIRHPRLYSIKMVTRTGFEPVNACVKGMCVNRFTNGPFSFMAPEIGLEPTTQRLTAVCSTN